MKSMVGRLKNAFLSGLAWVMLLSTFQYLSKGQTNDFTTTNKQPFDITVLSDYYRKFNDSDMQKMFEGSGEQKTLSDDTSDLEKKYMRNLASVFSVGFYTNEFGSNYTEINCGSGFYLNEKGFLLTSAHVLSGKKRCNVALSFIDRKYPVLSLLDIVAYSKSKDLALCLANESTNFTGLSFPNFVKGDLHNGDSIYTISLQYKPLTVTNDLFRLYPINEKILTDPFEVLPLDFKKNGELININHGETLYRLAISHSRGEVDDTAKLIFTKEIKAYPDLVSLIVKSEQGDSGKIVFNGRGEVAGILFLGDPESNRGAMMPSKVLREFLKAYQNYNSK